jgi:glycosyltransferase involved in cell wall biosynthesis
MKIACISASRIPSDTANSIQAMKMCQALAQLGHELTLLVPGREPPLGDREKLVAHYGLSTPFDIQWLSSLSRRLFTWQAARLAYRMRADILYCWPIQSAVSGLWMNLPVILEMHDLPSGRIGPAWYRHFLKTSGSKRVMFITHALHDVLEKKYGVSLSPSETIIAPNGVDLGRFAGLPDPETARRQLGLPQAPTVACTGHLYEGRGADLFLSLAAKFPQTNFLWVGGRRQDVAGWQSRAVAQGLKNVQLTGFVTNQRLPLFQAAAEILLMPYAREIAISSGTGRSAEISSPMKMFEYMASDRAIITSDLPVIREVLDDRMAVFCPPDDQGSWVIALEDLLRDPNRRQSLGRQARSEVEKYTWVRRAERALEGFNRT